MLVLRRPRLSLYRPGLDDIAGGGLKRGETDPETAAGREAFEETGLSVRDLQFIGAYSIVSTILGVRVGCTTHFFKGEIDEVAPEIDTTEHTSGLWVPNQHVHERSLPKYFLEQAILGEVIR